MNSLMNTATRLTRRLRWLRRRSPGDLAFVPLLTAIGVSAFISPYPKATVSGLLTLLSGPFVYLLVAKRPSRAAHMDWAWWTILLFGILLCLVAPPSMLPRHHRLFRWLPAYGALRSRMPDTFNRNTVAGALVVLVPLGAARTLSGPDHARPWARFCSALVTLAMLFVLNLTAAWGAYAATSVSLLLLFALVWPRAILWTVPPILIAALTGGALLGWRSAIVALPVSRIAAKLGQRTDIWARAIYLIRDFPMTGVGLGGFEPLVALMYPLFLNQVSTVSHAHNLFLQVAVDLGLPGLISYLAILGLSYYMGFSARRAFLLRGERHLGLLSAGCVASLAGICVHGLLDCAIWGNKGAFLPWVVFGLCAGLYRLSRGKPEHRRD